MDAKIHDVHCTYNDKFPIPLAILSKENAYITYLTDFRPCQSSPRNEAKNMHLPIDIQPDDMDLSHRRVCMYRIVLH